MIKWIFFDVGNVIFNDDPCMAEIYKAIFDEIKKVNDKVTFQEILKEREELILKENDPKHHHTIAKKYLGKREWVNLRRDLQKDISENYFKYNVLLPDISEQIKELSKEYSLGIIANQVSGSTNALNEIGLLKYFKVHGISADIGLEKPSLEFFKKILEMAKVKANESIMVGYRIDNDILPAKNLGMKTIWINHDIKTKGYSPKYDYQKECLNSQLIASVQNVRPSCENERPDRTINKGSELASAVNDIVNS